MSLIVYGEVDAVTGKGSVHLDAVLYNTPLYLYLIPYNTATAPETPTCPLESQVGVLWGIACNARAMVQTTHNRKGGNASHYFTLRERVICVTYNRAPVVS